MTQSDILTPDMLQVFETVPDLYLILSPDLRILTASNTYLAATLAVRQELVGKHVFEAFPDNPHTPEANSVKNLQASLQTVLSTHKPHQMALQRYDVPRPLELGGGFEEKYGQILNTPVLDEKGSVRYIIHKVNDITSQIKDQAQIKDLIASEQAALNKADVERKKLYDLFMQAPALIASVRGTDYVFDLVNPLYQQLFSGRELMGKPLLEAVPEIKGQPVMEILNKVYQTGESFNGTETPFSVDRLGNGTLETVYFDFIYQAIRGADGKVDGVIMFAYEITEAILTRQALKQLNQELEDQVAIRTEELKAAQADAEAERSKLHHLFMQAPALICIFEEPNHIFKLVNPLYQQLVGERPLLGKPIAKAMPELEGQPIFALLDKVYQTGESFFAHEMIVQLDHTNSGTLGENYYNFIYQATRNLEGNINGILVFAYEVTAQVLARRKVEQSEKKFQSLSEELAAANEKLKTTNLELFGAKQALELLNSELEERVQVRTKELKLAQAEAQHQRDQLQQVFEQAPVSICVFRGSQYVLEVVNPYMGELLGRSPTLLVGKPFFEAIPEIANQGFKELLDKVRLTGIPYIAHERTAQLERHGPSKVGYFNFVYQPLLDEHGQITGIICIAIDVTEQVEARQKIEQKEKKAQALAEELAITNKELATANEEIQASNEELSQSNRQLNYMNADLDNFIYTASHDLKAPIVNIEGLMKALVKQLPKEILQNERTHTTIDYIQEAVERFKRTIANLTEVVKLQKENSQPVTRVDLTLLLKEVQLDLMPQIREAGAKIEVDIEACPNIEFSEKNLRSILYNLLSNAIKYRSPERALVVKIYCQQGEEYQSLAIEDNGLGMKLSGEHKLFSMFRRFHDHVEGSGIGLYMVKKIIDNAGGKIEVESTVGVGSTFKIFFKR